MKLYIDPTGGMAGDMFSAALISLGVPFSQLHSPMVFAAKQLGEADISTKITDDNAVVLDIKLKSKSNHLGEKTGKRILNETFEKFQISKKHSTLGLEIFSILLNAEEKAHREFNIQMKGHHHHHGPVLHEAQDIIIDIVGACYGLANLHVLPEIFQIKPVSLGGGKIKFSHGEFNIPAPATKTIIEDHNLNTNSGPIDKELFTPTGAAILAALKPKFVSCKMEDINPVKIGISRGTKIFNIPPLTMFLVK